MGYRNPYTLPGQQTYVNEDNVKNIPPDEHFQGKGNAGGGQASPATKPDQRTQALPRERKPDSEIKRPAQPVVNSPPESGGHPAGSIHKDRMRTKGVPGDQYNPEPIDQSKGQFRRRSLNAEDIEAGNNLGKKPSGATRQRAQKGQAKKRSQLSYKKNKMNVKRRAKLRYRINKKKGLFRKSLKMRQNFPHWFKRKPGGGYSSHAQRARDWRKGIKRTRTTVNRKNANLVEEIEFVLFEYPIYMDGEGHCTLKGVNPNTGRVVYQYKDAYRNISLHDFFLRSVFAFEEHLEEFFDVLDTLFLDEEEWEDVAEDVEDLMMSKQAYKARRKNWGRNKKKRGIKFFKGKQYRLKTKARRKVTAQRYRRRMKRNPKFQKMQKIRARMQKANPRRFRLKMGAFKNAEVLTSPEIAFVAGKDLKLGFVRNLSTMTGWVTYKLGSGRVASMPLPAFLLSVVFLEEYDLEAFFDLIDVEIGLEAYDLEMDVEQLRMCMNMLEYDGASEEFKALCLSETGVASIDAMSPDHLESVASRLIGDVLMGGGRQVHKQPKDDFFPRDDDDKDDGLHSLYFGQVAFPEEYSIDLPSASKVAARCADLGVYDKADLVRRETNPKDKAPSSLPDGDEEHAYEGLPTWIGPSKLKEERENRNPAHGMPVTRDRPGAPGSAKVIPRGQGFVGRTASPSPAQSQFIKGLFDKLVRKGWIDSSKVLTDEQIETLDPKAVDKLIRELKTIRSENNEWEVDWYYGNGRPKWRKRSNRQIVAAKMSEIIKGCSPKLHERASTLEVARARIDPRNAVWLFDVQSQTDPSQNYRVRLKALRKGNLRSLSKADVLVSCNCNFWQWQGPEHWAKSGGYLYGKPMGTASAPNIKDPDKQHAACKHVLATLKYLDSKNVSFRSKKPKRKKR